ncbi:hypothetical protein GTQ99_10450, partial [Kineococcus sp. T13]|uniref:transglutaminase-like domain-containing protein n=1 Tax=Kineococcus vitellinus TaxID=2696565 RepID=UPI001412E588
GRARGGADAYATHAPTSAARGCALVAVGAAALALLSTGQLPAGGAVCALAALVAATLVRGRRAARTAGVAGAAAVAVWAPGLVADGGVPALWPVAALALAVGQVGTASTLRALRLALGLAVLVALAAAGIAPVPALAGPLALVWAGALAGFALSVPHRGADAAQRARSARALGAAGLAGLVLFLLLPQPDGAALPGGLGGERSAAGGARGGDGARTARAYADGELDLDARGELPLTPLLSVPADSPALWRAAVLDTYDGHGWSAAGAGTVWYERTGADDGQPRYVADAEEGAGGGGPQRTDAVEPLGDYPALVSAGAPAALATDAELAPTASGARLLPAHRSYVVTSTPVATTSDGAPAPGAGTAAAAPADPARWLQLPSSLPQRVRDLGAQLAGPRAGDPLAAARAVERHLRAGARYSLEAPVPDADEDSVAEFLFTDRIGFCEQFASAEVVLLRSAGVPARLVTGFSGGEPVAGDASRRVLRSADAHAWVEVWVPGRGWTSSDPTAGAPLVRGGAASLPARAWREVQQRVDALLADERARWLVAAALVALAGLGAGLLRWWRVRRAARGAGAGGAGARRDVVTVELLLALQAWEAALPAPLRRGAAEGLSAWAARLGAVAPRVPGTAALEVVERACFARRVPPPAELRTAREELQRAGASLLAATRRARGAEREHGVGAG